MNPELRYNNIIVHKYYTVYCILSVFTFKNGIEFILSVFSFKVLSLQNYTCNR